MTKLEWNVTKLKHEVKKWNDQAANSALNDKEFPWQKLVRHSRINGDNPLEVFREMCNTANRDTERD
jgi:hypothetical protein